MNEAPLSNDEEYLNAYFYFVRSLKVLSEESDAQCQILDSYNVAWELKDDVSRGVDAVLRLQNGRLTVMQKEAITRILSSLSNAPDCAWKVANSKNEQLRALSDPFWNPLRIYAKEALDLLEPETKLVQTLLRDSTHIRI